MEIKMTDKAWKRRERDIAEFFHGERNPLSGSSSKHTRADVIHDNFFIEVKLRKRHSAITLWDEVKVMADKENKTPVICLCEKNRPGFWILIHSEDFLKI